MLGSVQPNTGGLGLTHTFPLFRLLSSTSPHPFMPQHDHTHQGYPQFLFGTFEADYSESEFVGLVILKRYATPLEKARSTQGPVVLAVSMTTPERPSQALKLSPFFTSHSFVQRKRKHPLFHRRLHPTPWNRIQHV